MILLINVYKNVIHFYIKKNKKCKCIYKKLNKRYLTLIRRKSI